jgi:dihydrofolate synthase/folylpolyglutamate synthase
VVALEWTLDRTREVLRAVGDPHLAYPTIHVAGTNGKGSVAAMCASVLSVGGRRVGLYTSPHLCSYRERFRLGLEPVSEARLRAAAADVYDAVAAGSLTFFEASTVLGLQLFARESVDVAVVEVGLGGRLDATNVVEPAVTAITNIGWDHTAYLGDSLEDIAREKAGIVKPRVPLVTGEENPEIRRLLREEAERVGATIDFVSSASVRNLRWDPVGSHFDLDTASWGTIPLVTPLPGGHQAHNSALALRILEHLPPTLHPDRESARQGIRDVRWPGRMQVERVDRGLWIFDVAHNEAGARALASTLDVMQPPPPLLALVALQSDKDVVAVAGPVVTRASHTLLTAPPSVLPERRWDAEDAKHRLAGLGSVEVVSDFTEAVDRLRRTVGAGTVLVTGSHHTVGDALATMGLPPCRARGGE